MKKEDKEVITLFQDTCKRLEYRNEREREEFDLIEKYNELLREVSELDEYTFEDCKNTYKREMRTWDFSRAYHSRLKAQLFCLYDYKTVIEKKLIDKVNFDLPKQIQWKTLEETVKAIEFLSDWKIKEVDVRFS